MIHYKGRLGVLKVGELRHQILVESHNSRNPIHAGATNMYGDPWEFLWWNHLRSDTTNFVAKYPDCQQIKVEHHNP